MSVTFHAFLQILKLLSLWQTSLRFAINFIDPPDLAKISTELKISKCNITVLRYVEKTFGSYGSAIIERLLGVNFNEIVAFFKFQFKNF